MRLPARKLVLGDPPSAWEALGFATEAGRMALGGVAVELGGAGGGVLGLEIQGLSRERPDALPIVAAGDGEAATGPPHPLGATAIDHLVIFTDDLARTVAALEESGLELRRRREGPVPQAFFNLDTTVLEVGELSPQAAERVPWAGGAAAGARFWGATLVVEDLDAAARHLGPLLGAPRDAVQPGRRIATVRREAGLGLAVALITPRVRTR